MNNASLGQLTTASDSLWWMAICNILDSGVTMQLKLVKTRIRPIATQKFLIDGHRIAYGVFGVRMGASSTYPRHSIKLLDLVQRRSPNYGSRLRGPRLFDQFKYYGLPERARRPEVDESMSSQVQTLEGLLRNKDKFHLVAHDTGGRNRSMLRSVFSTPIAYDMSPSSMPSALTTIHLTTN